MPESLKDKIIVNPIIQDAIRLTAVEGLELRDLRFRGTDLATGIEHIFAMRSDETLPENPLHVSQSSHHFSIQDPISQTLPRMKFKFLNILGQGRFSTVFAGLDLKKKRKVALKVYRASDEFLEYFNHEITMLKQIEGKTHPNVVACHGHFILHTKRGRHGVIIFDLVPNTLKNLLRGNKKGLPLPQAKRITNQVAQGLAFLHQHALIHADIKPENLLIDESGTVKICDIGSGCLAHAVENVRVGTIPYIAPELLLGCKYDQKADIWSLGCLFFELSTNSCPFDPDIYFEEYSDETSDENTSSSTSSIVASRSSIESNGSHGSSSGDDDDFFEQEITHFQLCHFRSLLGDFPHDLFQSGIYYSMFFNSCQEIRVVPRYIDDRPLATVMTDDLEIPISDAQVIERECLKMMKLDPRERPAAANIFIA